MDGSREGGPDLQRVAENLKVDQVTVDVLQRFRAAGLPCIVLKGPTFATWLYPPGERGYTDSDVLVPDVAQAEAIVAEMGFRHVPDDLPGDHIRHARSWMREEDDALVDIHSSLPGALAPPAVVWRVLEVHGEDLTIGGTSARGLDVAGRLLHVALHAAQHGATFGHPLTDLERAIAICDVEEWRGALDLAVRLDAREAFARGLTMVPGGTDLCRRLGVEPVVSVSSIALMGGVDTSSMFFEELATARGRGRAAILWRKVFPPPSFFRTRSSLAHKGALGLGLAYVLRWCRLVLTVPRGLAGWIRARRALRARSR